MCKKKKKKKKMPWMSHDMPGHCHGIVRMAHDMPGRCQGIITMAMPWFGMGMPWHVQLMYSTLLAVSTHTCLCVYHEPDTGQRVRAELEVSQCHPVDPGVIRKVAGLRRL